MCDVDKMVNSSQVDNDQHFKIVSAEDKQRNDDIDLLVKISYWTKLKIADGFHKQVQLVITLVWKDKMINLSKKNINTVIKNFSKLCLRW